MGLMTPDLCGAITFKVVANRNDLTAAISDRLFSMQLTDGAGIESDLLEFVLVDDDVNAPIEVPPTGAEIQFSLGYETFYRDMGLFVVDETEISGWPLALIVRARAAPFDGTKYGKDAIQEQKNRSWEKGSSMKTLVETLAKEHGLKAAVSASMAGISLPHFDQREESDLNFLIRVARKYDGVVKPAGGYLTVTKRGEAISATGAALQSIDIRAQDVTAFRQNNQKRDTAGTVISYYKVTKKAARTEVKVGSGDPVKRIGTNYPNKEMAVNAARAEYGRRLRGQQTLNITVMGWPELMAEMIVNVLDLHPNANGEWLTKTVTHRIGTEGYVCDLVLEKPNSDEEPETTERVLKSPKVGSKEDEDDDGDGGVITLPPS